MPFMYLGAMAIPDVDDERVRYDTFRWRSENYVQDLIDRLKVASPEGLALTEGAIRADPDRPDSVKTLLGIAEDFVSGNSAPLQLVSDVEIEAFIEAHTRPMAIAEQLEEPPQDMRASRFHGTACLPPGAEWPVGPSGQPLTFLGQFDLDEIGIRPPAVESAGYLALFVEQDENGIVDCGELVVFEAASREHVIPIAKTPEGVITRDPIWLRFKTIPSLPALDDPYVTLPNGLTHEDSWRSNLAEAVLTRYEDTNYQTLVGGWTHQVQMNFPCPGLDKRQGDVYPMVMQIGEEHGLDYGDGGYLYIAKGRLAYDAGPDRPAGSTGWMSEIQTF